MTKVSLLKCQSYDSQLLKQTIAAGLTNIGFDPSSLKNKRVGLKPNLLTIARPDQAVVTDPEFVRAVIHIVKENGGTPVIVESPAVHSPERVMRKSGYSDLLDTEMVEFDNTNETGPVRSERAVRFKKFDVRKSLFDCDIIINLPKLKTHGLMYVTGAIKNLFGTIPGLNKAQCHIRAKTNFEFALLLLDLFCCLIDGFKKPKNILTIMDAIVGMEGEGPGISGVPRKIGAIITGIDPIAVDFIAVNLLGLNVNQVLTIEQGASRNLGIASMDSIEIVGDSLDSLQLDDFIPSKSAHTGFIRWIFGSSLIKNLLIAKPHPSYDKCTLCYQCRKICPAEAIRKAGEGGVVPLYDYNKCIRCYCCMEICPEAAISIKPGALQWLWGKWMRFFNSDI